MGHREDSFAVAVHPHNPSRVRGEHALPRLHRVVRALDRAVASRTARRARLSRAVASVSSGPSVITRAKTTLSATRRASLGVASVPRRDVRARAENDGRGPNPNEVEGVSFGGEMVGVGIFLLVAVQFFVLAFVDFPFQR